MLDLVLPEVASSPTSLLKPQGRLVLQNDRLWREALCAVRQVSICYIMDLAHKLHDTIR